MNNTPFILKDSLVKLLPSVKAALFFGFFINFLMLAPSWYMLEVYDRVVNSRNTTTLLMLTLMVIGVYIVMEILDWVRTRTMYHASSAWSLLMQKKVFDAAFLAKLQHPDFSSQQVFADFKALKESVYSPAFMALIDVPFSLIFIVAVFYMHSLLGWVTLLGLLLQVCLTIFNQMRIQPDINQANQEALAAQNYFTGALQRAEVIQAMGMLPAIQARWYQRQAKFLMRQAKASELAGIGTVSARFLQTFQSALILGLGCYLAINQQIEQAGAVMIIASILSARALTPFVQLAGSWRTLAQVKESYTRLNSLLEKFNRHQAGMALPAPTGALTVEHLIAGKPGSKEAFLRYIHFKLEPGSLLIITGSSASGKTSLSKYLLGLYPPLSGSVRFDGVEAYAWNKEELGQYLGYLPQHLALFDGSIAANIARFGELDEEQVNLAIDLVGLTSFVASLPQGIHSAIGEEGAYLSGGRRQLIGLARAVYGNPKILILDEPNSSLDEVGTQALQQALLSLKQRACTVIVISHLQNLTAIADYLMIMVNGQQYKFGKVQEVMAFLNHQQSLSQQASAKLRLVHE